MGLAVAEVVEGSGLGEAGVEPVGGLIDGSEMVLGGIGIGDEERDRRVSAEASEEDAEGAGFGIWREVIGEPEAGEGEAVGGCVAFDEAESLGGAGAEGDGSPQVVTAEDAEGKASSAGEGMEVVVLFEQGPGDWKGNGANIEGLDRRGRS